MKLAFFTNSILILFIACSNTNLLTYKSKKYYNENSIILKDSIFGLLQNICYNRPGIIDEEFCHELEFRFLDTSLVQTKKTLKLLVDTLVVRSNYCVFSVWDWDGGNYKVDGEIEIISWNKDSITLKENVLVTDTRTSKTKKFIGTRTFRRKKGW